jgi:hypothetical protein
MKLDEKTPVHHFIQYESRPEEGNLASLLTGKLAQIQNRFVDSVAAVTDIKPGKTELTSINKISRFVLGKFEPATHKTVVPSNNLCRRRSCGSWPRRILEEVFVFPGYTVAYCHSSICFLLKFKNYFVYLVV